MKFEIVQFCVLLAFCWLVAEAKKYHGYQLFEISTRSQHHINVLKQFEDQENDGDNYDFWKHPSKVGDNATILVAPRLIAAFIQTLKNEGLSFTVLNANVQRIMDEEVRLNSRAKLRGLFRTGSGPALHTYYMRYNEMKRWLMEKSRSDSMVELETIGQTSENRDIVLTKIGLDKSKPIIWIDAGIHAREWIAPATALYLIDQLLKAENNNIVGKYQFYIVHLVNPDGYEYSHTTARLWRKNRSYTDGYTCRGVDLNRNFPYRWGGEGASPAPCSSTYRGAFPTSEFETQAITGKLQNIKSQLSLYLTLHSYGQYIMSPFGYSRNRYPRNYPKLMQMGNTVSSVVRRKYGRMYMVGSAADLLYEAPGGSDDYATGQLEVPHSYTIELPDRGRYGFNLPPSYIRDVGRQMWAAVVKFVELM